MVKTWRTPIAIDREKQTLNYVSRIVELTENSSQNSIEFSLFRSGSACRARRNNRFRPRRTYGTGQ
jgi:hypothetical protein